MITTGNIGDYQLPGLTHPMFLKWLIPEQGFGKSHPATGKMGDRILFVGLEQIHQTIGIRAHPYSVKGSDPARIKSTGPGIVQPCARIIIPHASHQPDV